MPGAETINTLAGQPLQPLDLGQVVLAGSITRPTTGRGARRLSALSEPVAMVARNRP